MGETATPLKGRGLPSGKTELEEDLHGHYNQMSGIALSHLFKFIYCLHLWGAEDTSDRRDTLSFELVFSAW